MLYTLFLNWPIGPHGIRSPSLQQVVKLTCAATDACLVVFGWRTMIRERKWEQDCGVSVAHFKDLAFTLSNMGCYWRILCFNFLEILHLKFF